MPDLINKVVFEIPPTLRVLNGLPLPDNLKDIFSPFATGTVVLLDEAGSWIMAKVNKQATFLKGGDLVVFLEAQGYSRLELSHMGDNYFKVIPSREVPEHNLEQTATQLSLEFSFEEQNSQETISSLGKAGSGKAPGKPKIKTIQKTNQKPLEKSTEKPENILETTDGSPRFNEFTGAGLTM